MCTFKGRGFFGRDKRANESQKLKYYAQRMTFRNVMHIDFLFDFDTFRRE